MLARGSFPGWAMGSRPGALLGTCVRGFVGVYGRCRCDLWQVVRPERFGWLLAWRPLGRLGASGRNSVAECHLPKVDVAGSNPVARSSCIQTER